MQVKIATGLLVAIISPINGRYAWNKAINLKTAIRLREREDLEMLVGETRKQIDRSLYARITYKF